MAPPLQALSILHLLLLAASILVVMVGSEDKSPAPPPPPPPPPPSGYSFELKHAGPKEQLSHIKLQIDGVSPVFAMADTGSDLIWLQHDKCSSGPISCSDDWCDTLMGNMKCCHGHCLFERRYGHSSFARGFMVKSKLTTEEPGKTTKDLTFGCALDFGCPKVKKEDCDLYKAGGIVGLGRGKLSLVSQLGLKRFSFCLPDYRDPNLKSKIKFGDHAAALPGEGHGQVKFVEYIDPHKYYVNLKKISMGTKNIIGNGVMLIDSGASFSKLPRKAFGKVEKHVKDLMRQKEGGGQEPKEHYKNKGFTTCYDLNELPKGMPEMVLQFDDTKMLLPVERYMYLDKKWSEVCLAIIEAPENRSTLGNFQMQNIYMLFDLTDEGLGTLSFRQVDCSDHLS